MRKFLLMLALLLVSCAKETPPVDFLFLEFRFVPETEIIEVVGAFKNNTDHLLTEFVSDAKFMDFDSINDWLLREANVKPIQREIGIQEMVFLTFTMGTGTKHPVRVYCGKEPMRLKVSASWRTCPRLACEMKQETWNYQGRCKSFSNDPPKYAMQWGRVEAANGQR